MVDMYISLSSLSLSLSLSLRLSLYRLYMQYFDCAWSFASDELTVINKWPETKQSRAYQLVRLRLTQPWRTFWLQTPADTPGCQEQLFVLHAHPTGGFVSFGCAWGKSYWAFLSVATIRLKSLYFTFFLSLSFSLSVGKCPARSMTG